MMCSSIKMHIGSALYFSVFNFPDNLKVLGMIWLRVHRRKIFNETKMIHDICENNFLYLLVFNKMIKKLEEFTNRVNKATLTLISTAS
jgi:hypothetical protein